VADYLPRELADLARCGVPSDRTRAVEAFIEPIFIDGALTRRTKMVMLFLAATAVGNEREGTRGITAALASGLSRQELLDALLAGALCRGAALLWRGAQWLPMAPLSPDARWGPPVPAASPEDMIGFLIEQNPAGAVPVHELAASAPDVLEAYYQLRSTVLADGPFPRRHKELMLVAINAAERFERGVEVHLEASIACGATLAEAAEALLVATIVGGVPAWQAGAHVLARVRHAAAK